jgi:hypothetical protein
MMGIFGRAIMLRGSAATDRGTRARHHLVTMTNDESARDAPVASELRVASALQERTS